MKTPQQLYRSKIKKPEGKLSKAETEILSTPHNFGSSSSVSKNDNLRGSCDGNGDGGGEVSGIGKTEKSGNVA